MPRKRSTHLGSEVQGVEALLIHRGRLCAVLDEQHGHLEVSLADRPVQ